MTRVILSSHPRALSLLAALAFASACATSGSNSKNKPQSNDPYEQGLDAKGNKKTDEAMRDFRKAIEQNHHHLDAWRALVQLYYDEGRLAEIRSELESRVKGAPDDDVLHYALGLAEFTSSAEAGTRAITEFKRAAELAPTESEYPFREGVALLELERYEEATPALKRAVELAPKQAKYHVPLGLALARQGDRPGALDQFRALLALAPSSRDVQLAQKAIARLDDPLRDLPKSESDNFQKAIESLNKFDNPQQAIDTLLDIADRYPDLAPVHALLGLAYERLDDAGPAVDHLKRAIELRPDVAEPYLYLADLYLSKQKPEVASGYFEKALERNPLADHAHEALGVMAVTQADAPTALAHFHALVVLRPDDPMSHKLMAQGDELAGKYDLAENELKTLIDKNDRDVDARLRLGYLYMALKQRSPTRPDQVRYAKLAEETFQKILDVQPENVAASRALKQLHEQAAP
jgi:tetratricopeptide (TPR) repeat protein